MSRIVGAMANPLVSVVMPAYNEADTIEEIVRRVLAVPLRIELIVFTDNAAAIALYRKFGFELEGTHRAYALRDGRYVDALAMARLHPNPPRIDA